MWHVGQNVSQQIAQLSGSFSVLAHAGHGTTDSSQVTHYLTEPIHVILFFALGAICLALLMAKLASLRPQKVKTRKRSPKS